MKRTIMIALVMSWMTCFLSYAQEMVNKNRTEFGLRTNAVTWLAGAPSIGVDVRFADFWQIGVDAAYSCCEMDKDTQWTRVQTVGLQARRYFRPFGTTDVGSRGWFMGLDARCSHYGDQLFNQNDGTHGDVWSGGVIGGYSFALGKNGHWGIDAVLGLGFLHKDYVRYEWYEPAEMFRVVDSAIKNKLGLTTLEVSLTYKF